MSLFLLVDLVKLACLMAACRESDNKGPAGAIIGFHMHFQSGLSVCMVWCITIWQPKTNLT